MLHIYRQITGLRRVRPMVVAQKRENEQRFPFQPVYVVGKPPTHFLRRLWFRQLRDQPWMISQAELEKLVRILDAKEARLLHIYFGHIAVHLLPLIRSWGKPSIVSFHGADVGVDLEKPAYRTATLEMLGAVRRVLVRSKSLQDALVRLGCPMDKIDLLRTGIPLGEFPYRERALPANGEWRLVQACRLIEKKGLTTSLHAMRLFLQRFPKAVLEIAGEGPLLSSLQAQVAERHLQEQVRLRGFLSQHELRDLYNRSHIFLHPSQTGTDGNQEGIPNSMLEAMATGLPVFATRHGGIPEAVENGISGVLVAEKDAKALAHALVSAAEDPESLGRMGKAAAEAVRRDFDQPSQIRRLEDIYLETM